MTATPAPGSRSSASIALDQVWNVVMALFFTWLVVRDVAEAFWICAAALALLDIHRNRNILNYRWFGDKRKADK